MAVNILVMLCDGRVVCGCADPYARRVLGDLRHNSVREVWTGRVLTALRADLNAGGSTFCGDCALKLPLKMDQRPVVRPIRRPRAADPRHRAPTPGNLPSTRVHNLSTRPFPATATYGRRLVRLGAQLCSAQGTLIELDFARADLPHDLAPGSSVDVNLRLPALTKPGRYTLKLDLVNKGVDWFERCGSDTTIRPFWVI